MNDKENASEKALEARAREIIATLTPEQTQKFTSGLVMFVGGPTPIKTANKDFTKKIFLERASLGLARLEAAQKLETGRDSKTPDRELATKLLIALDYDLHDFKEVNDNPRGR